MSQSVQSMADQIGVIFDTNNTPRACCYAAITASASGATTIVAAIAGKSIIVLRWNITANGNVNVKLQSTTTTAIATGLHYMTQYASAGGAWCPGGIFATVPGEGLDINLSGAQAVGGELTYVAI
jgi:hypothetical protein